MLVSVFKKVFIFVLLTFFISRELSADSTISITNGEWQPYLSNYSYEYGLASHIVHEAFKLEGVNIEWGFFPWARAYQNAEAGEEWDASAVWWPTEETRNKFLLSEAVVNTSFVFFHLKTQKFNWQSMQELKGYEIGFTLGYDYGSEFMSELKGGGISVQSVASDEQNFKKLLLGRIDLFPNDPLVGYAQIKTIFSPEKAALFTHHPKTFEPSTLHLIFSKKSKKSDIYLKKFNSGLKKLKESGRISQMYIDLYAGKYDKQKVEWVRTE